MYKVHSPAYHLFMNNVLIASFDEHSLPEAKAPLMAKAIVAAMYEASPKDISVESYRMQFDLRRVEN